MKLIEHFVQSYSAFYIGLCFKSFWKFTFVFMHQFVVLSHSVSFGGFALCKSCIRSFGGFAFVHTKL